MRTSLCIALGLLTTAVVCAADTVAKEQEAVEPAQVAVERQTREPKVSFDEAVELAKEEMKQKKLDKRYFIRRVSYETHGQAPPRWMFILSPKALKAPKAEPGLRIEMDGSVTMIKGH